MLSKFNNLNENLLNNLIYLLFNICCIIEF